MAATFAATSQLYHDTMLLKSAVILTEYDSNGSKITFAATTPPSPPSPPPSPPPPSSAARE
jgi:hypothetical protein